MSDAAALAAALEALARRVDEATRESVGLVAHLMQAEVMKQAPVGVTGNSTNAPGDLRRSVDVQGPYGGDGSYEARVGPTMVYSRQREFGGHIYPRSAKMLRFRKFGVTYYRRHVYQKPNPYTKRGYDAGLPKVPALVAEKLTVAIEGG